MPAPAFIDMRSAKPDSRWPDTWFVATAMGLAMAPWVTGLGFQADDYGFLGVLAFTPDQSLAGLIHTLQGFGNVRERPGQAIWMALLYRLFGLAPAGYHLAVAAFQVAAVALFHRALVALGQPRNLALALPLLYGVLPHASTGLFWYAAMMAPFSAAMFFLSLLFEAKAAGAARPWPAKAGALSAMLAGLSCYEVFLPLYAFTPVLARVLVAQGRGERPALMSRRALALILPNTFLILAVGLAKAALTVRLAEASPVRHLDWFATFLGGQMSTTVLGPWGLGLPGTLVRIVRDYPDPLLLAATPAFGLAIFAWLARPDGAGGQEPAPARFRALGLLGIATFVLGWLIFLTNFNAGVSAAGIDNRTGGAASLGVALLGVALIGAASSLMPAGFPRRAGFAALAALACAAGFLVLGTLARFWIEAWGRQQAVLDGLVAVLPAPPPGATILMDGVCPFAGPAPVFAAWWDVGGAIQLRYGRPDLRGDLVTPRMRVTEDGITTTVYGRTIGPYAYAGLLAYDHPGKRVVPLAGPLAATRWFGTVSAPGLAACPRSSGEGSGVPVLTAGAPVVEFSR